MSKELPFDLKQLKYFINVAEFGSFTKAAYHLDVAQPLLSKQIRRLEVNIRHNLLVRNGRGVAVTDVGKILLEHAYGIINQVECACEEMKQGQLNGKVRIGLPPTMAKLIAVPLTKTFKLEMPNANLIIMEGLTSVIEERLLTGKIDMGLLHNLAFSPDLDITPLDSEELCLIAPESDQSLQKTNFTLAEIATLPLILPSHPNSYRLLIESEIIKICCKPNIVLEMNSVNTILELVCEKMGYAILSARTLAYATHSEKLVAYPINSPKLINKLFMGVSNKRIMTQTQKYMKKVIEDFFRNI